LKHKRLYQQLTDSRGRGAIDFALAFHPKKVVNSPGGRQGEIVVIENLGRDS
jgi:hypothetical protein